MNDKTSKYITTRKARELFGVSEDTLRRWANQGDIQHIRTPGGKRLYAATKYINNQKEEDYDNQKEKERICYCRVSSASQKEDLLRQEKYMQEKFPRHRIISDIGSGINFKRKGLRSILEMSIKGNVEEVVVAYRDRLCRFAYELIEWLLHQNGVKLLVLNEKVESSENSELADDLLSIINVFNCRVNGKRKYKNIEKTKENEVTEVTTGHGKKNKSQTDG